MSSVNAGWAKPGVKCVIVDRTDYDPDSVLRGTMPDRGEVLTVSGTNPDYDGRGVHLLIEGHPNPTMVSNDVGWRASRFRPLLTKTMEEDMELFTPLLTPTKSANNPLYIEDIAAQEGGMEPVSTIVERIDYHGMMLDAAWRLVEE